jgi:hypothetical protein
MNPLFNRYALSLLVLFSYLCLVVSCEKTGQSVPPPVVPTVKATFDVIQDQIFTTSCAVSGCHASTSDPSYAQHGLVLTKGVSYNNLLGKLAKNTAAATLKLQLVKQNDADNSFLYHKITCGSLHHSSNANFGARMPLSGYLSKGQVELVRQWINQGASQDKETVNLSVLKDSIACQEDITPLAAPTQGFQLKIDLFSIPKNFEREIFVRRNTPNISPVYVNRIEMKGRSNSHHFVVYTFRSNTNLPKVNQVRDIRNLDGSLDFLNTATMQNHIFLGGGTDVNADITLPAGVALKIEPETALDLNTHYFNKTNLTLQGENYVNFHTIPENSVLHNAKTLDLNNLDISIPAGQTKTFSKTFTFNTITRVVMLTSHFHKLGQKFVIKISGGARNGEIVYTNTDWEHPLVKSFNTPIILQSGEGLTSEVTYVNKTVNSVGFGLTSEDEMNIIFGYWY